MPARYRLPLLLFTLLSAGLLVGLWYLSRGDDPSAAGAAWDWRHRRLLLLLLVLAILNLFLFFLFLIFPT
jgi:hypothetical protein